MLIPSKKINLILKKKFIVASYLGKNITFNIDNVNIPFGTEKYEGKYILNIELLQDNNEHHNFISKFESIENDAKNMAFENINLNIIQNIKGKGFIPTVKQSLKGHIIRTHFDNPDIYVLKKDNEKLYLDESNLKNTECKIILLLSGIWFTDNNFGLLWNIDDIQIKKIN